MFAERCMTSQMMLQGNNNLLMSIAPQFDNDVSLNFPLIIYHS